MRPKEWTVFWRKLEGLLKSGLPLVDALKLLQRESRGTVEQKSIGEILARLQAGDPFCKAVQSQSALGHGLLLAGERAGQLGDAISDLAGRLEAQEKLSRQIKGACVYPALVGALCVGLVVLLVNVVLPRFAGLFVALGVKEGLPPLTQGLMNFAEFVRVWGVWLMAAVAGLVIYFKLRPEVGVRVGNFLAARMPVVSALRRLGFAESFLGTLGLLLKHGLPLDEALRVTVESLPSGRHKIYAPFVERVAQGELLSACLRTTGDFEESQLEVLAIAERAGAMVASCERLGGVARERLAEGIKTAVGLLEPALVIAMAGLVGLIVAALFMPLMPMVAHLAEGV